MAHQIRRRILDPDDAGKLRQALGETLPALKDWDPEVWKRVSGFSDRQLPEGKELEALEAAVK